MRKSSAPLAKSREKDIIDSLRIYDAEHHPVGETLPMDQHVYRLKVLKTFLRTTIPLTKLDIFRDILEENALRVTDRRHMSDLTMFSLSFFK